MKTFSRKTVVFSIILCISVVLSVIGILSYFHNQDKIQGAFFRKMYGSVGVVGDSRYYLRFSLFCFNSDASFLNSVEKCRVNGGVNLVDISVEEQARESDLVVYNVNLGLSFPDEGQYDVTELYYDNGIQTQVFSLGKVSFVHRNGTPLFIPLGMDSQIINGDISYTFSAENTESFTITDVVLAKDDSISYQYKENCVFNPGTALNYLIHMNHSVSEYDLCVIQPIFQLESAAEEYNGLVTPIMVAYTGKDMNYMEIKEYVK